MPVTIKVFDAIIDDLIEGYSLRQTLHERCIAPRAFHAALLRDPKLACLYMDIKQDAGVDIVYAALEAGDMRAAGIAMRKADRMLPRKDWVAAAEEATRARRARQWDRDGETLARIEARIEARRLKEMHCRPVPPPRLPTIDDLQKTGDVISIYDLRRRGVLQPEWTFINNPSRHPAVARLVAARYRLQIHFKCRDVPQSVAIEWIPTAVCDRPMFVCGCGRRALKLYPTAKACVCRFCVLGGATRYRASSKYRSPNRKRVRAPIAHGRHERPVRDPATGRFLPSTG